MARRARLDPVAKRKIPYPCRESNPGRPAPISVTMLIYQKLREGKGNLITLPPTLWPLLHWRPYQ